MAEDDETREEGCGDGAGTSSQEAIRVLRAASKRIEDI
jgi:hypothetical protein